MCTYTCAHLHTRTHPTQVHTRTLTCACLHAHTGTPTHVHTHTCTHVHVRTRGNTYTGIHMHTHTHVHSRTHTCAQTRNPPASWKDGHTGSTNIGVSSDPGTILGSGELNRAEKNRRSLSLSSSHSSRV